MSLVVNGSIGIDSVITPTASAENVLGGSAVYFAAAASFFTDVRLVAAVGEDFPEEFMGTFAHYNIDASGLEKRAGAKTFSWTGKYLDNMNDRETLDVQLNVLGEDLPPIPEAFLDTEYVFLANTHPGAQQVILDSFPKGKFFVADTMDLWINTARETVVELCSKVNGLVLNDSEAILFTGETNLIKAADKILELGPDFTVIKKGEHGSLLVSKDGICALPAYPADKVVDPTGAGDSFAGAMMGYLAAMDKTDFSSLKRAIAYGTVTASFNIESFTLDRLATLTRKEIDERLNEFMAVVSF